MNEDKLKFNFKGLEHLNCNWSRKLLVSYLSIFSPYMMVSTTGLVLLRIWTGKYLSS